MYNTKANALYIYMMKKKRSAILITAATKRIGYHLSRKSLLLGFDVIAHYRSSKGALSGWLSRNPGYKSRVHFYHGDLISSAEDLFEYIASLPVSLCGLVNNASLFSKGNVYDIEHLYDMMHIHFMVPARLGTLFSRSVKNGWIINMSDAITEKPNLNFQNYRMSKHFLCELTRQQAVTYAPHIRVNALAPGAMLPSEVNGKSDFNSLKDIIPLRKTGDISSLLNAFEFLITDTYCTGQTLKVDGGWHLTV